MENTQQILESIGSKAKKILMTKFVVPTTIVSGAFIGSNVSQTPKMRDGLMTLCIGTLAAASVPQIFSVFNKKTREDHTPQHLLGGSLSCEPLEHQPVSDIRFEAQAAVEKDRDTRNGLSADAKADIARKAHNLLALSVGNTITPLTRKNLEKLSIAHLDKIR